MMNDHNRVSLHPLLPSGKRRKQSNREYDWSEALEELSDRKHLKFQSMVGY